MKNRKKFISVMAGIMAAIMVLSLILSLIPVAHAKASDEIRGQINDLKAQQSMIRQEMDSLREQYKQNENEIADLVSRKLLIDQEIFLLNAQISVINDQISAFALLIADKQDELDEAEDRFRALNEEYKDRIRIMEEEGSMSYWEVIFRASSFSDLIDRLNMIQEIAGADRRRLEQLDAAAKAVEETKALLTQEKAGLEETKLGLEQAQKELERKSAEASTLLNELIAKGEEYIKYVEECEEQDRIMMEQIADKQHEYDKAKYSEWLATSVPPTTRPASRPNTVDGITWLVPTQNYRITSPYGMRIHPVYGYPKMHTGVDLAAPLNTPIYATRAGVVVWAGWGSTGGWWVKVDHGDGFASTYLHLTRYVVKIGDFVEAGQIVGYMGSTGVSTGSHLHFGIMFNGEWVNPLKYVKA